MSGFRDRIRPRVDEAHLQSRRSSSEFRLTLTHVTVVACVLDRQPMVTAAGTWAPSAGSSGVVWRPLSDHLGPVNRQDWVKVAGHVQRFIKADVRYTDLAILSFLLCKNRAEAGSPVAVARTARLIS